MPKVAFAICEITVGVPLSNGVAQVRCAKYEIPNTNEPRIADIKTSVLRAFTPSGARKSETPSEMASRPVSDDPPFAKARKRMNMAAKLRRPLASPIATAPCIAAGSNLGRVPFAIR